MMEHPDEFLLHIGLRDAARGADYDGFLEVAHRRSLHWECVKQNAKVKSEAKGRRDETGN